MKIRSLISLGIFAVAIACSSDPKPISYGNENCNYCSMTIMDDKHAAELITQKGRVYTFDSIECLVRSLDQFKGSIGSVLVMDFNNPDTFIDANTATFLISPELPSPMGANLSAFTNADEAVKTGFKKGVLYNWNDLRTQIN